LNTGTSFEQFGMNDQLEHVLAENKGLDERLRVMTKEFGRLQQSFQEAMETVELLSSQVSCCRKSTPFENVIVS
jgi:hypothetical protein